MSHQPTRSVPRLRNMRQSRAVKPEYAMTGVLVGIAMGWVVGLGLELVYHKHTLLMLASSIAGLALGTGFEAIRLRWRLRRFRTLNESKHRFL